MKLKILLAALLVNSLLYAQVERNLLVNSYKKAEIPSFPQQGWQPFGLNIPTCFDRVSPATRTFIVENAEKYLGRPIELLPASLYLDYKITGNRDRFQNVYFDRRRRLATQVLAELLENKGRFVEDIANVAWAITEESSWCLPAHLNSKAGLPETEKPVLDLFAGETASLLAWTHFLLRDKLDRYSSAIDQRIVFETTKRVIDPYLENDGWWWLGFDPKREVNNWNPWINSNVTAAVLFIETDPVKQRKFLEKSLKSVDRFINSYNDDGGCDEGPGYWSMAAGAMFDYLELIHSASKGKIDIYDQPIIRKMARFISNAWIAGDYFINFSDAGAKSIPNGVHTFRFGNRINDRLLMDFGIYHLNRSAKKNIDLPSFGSLNRVVADLVVYDSLKRLQTATPKVSDVWLDKLEVAAAHSSANPDTGLYFAAYGGHNAQNHNHNDVGNFVVFKDGKPFLIDVGVGEYTAKTFSKNRYEIWTMQSAYHNLPSINGVLQHDGASFKAVGSEFASNKSFAQFKTDMASAYPPEAEVKTWWRTIKLLRNKRLELTEQYELKNYVAPTILHLMTACDVALEKPGVLKLTQTSKVLRIYYDPVVLEPTLESMPLNDTRLNPVWGSRLCRINLKVVSNQKRNTLNLVIK